MQSTSRPNPPHAQAMPRHPQRDHLGVAIDIAAYDMGAKWNERHFTKDRTLKGTDHAASLEPPGMSKLCRDLRATWSSMTHKESEIPPIEATQRKKLKWGFYNKI